MADLDEKAKAEKRAAIKKKARAMFPSLWFVRVANLAVLLGRSAQEEAAAGEEQGAEG